ncbi:MAG TPA: polysaccharide deacetylase family protein, partial [Mycobacterium sp.]
MGGFGFPLVALQGRVRALTVMVGVAVVAMLLPLVGVAPAAQAAAATTVVSLTFDDTNADQMAAATTMQASGLHGTFYAISGSIGTPNYLTLANLQTLYGAGNEIGGHTVNHPDLTLEPADEAQRQICDARNQLTAWGFPQTSFAYPYATVTASVETIVKNCGYNSARSLGDVQTQLGGTAGLYAETVPPPDAFALRAPDEVDSTWTLTALQNTVTNAETHGGGWDILTFHHVCEPGTTNCDPTVSITPELFTQFTTWLAAHLQSVPTTTVKTVNQVIGGTVQPAVTAPAPPAVAGALTNASLETAVTPGVPNCWSAYAYGTNTPAYTETSPGHTGTVAETVTMTGYTNGDAKLMPTFDTGGCSPAATAGHSYQLGAWYKSTGVTQFEVYYRTATGAFVYWTSSPYFAAATAWTQAVWTTPALPAGATGISFGLNILGNGTLTTDDYTDVDVTPALGAVMSLPPARIMDTRTNLGVTGPVPALGTVSLQVTGQGGVPASGVSAVVVNVTAADPTSAGYITVWPSGTTMQQTSNLNFQAGQNIPNLVVVPVGADGKIQLFNGSGGTVQLIADVTGYILGGTPTLPGAVASLSPARIMDTRTNLGVTGP